MEDNMEDIVIRNNATNDNPGLFCQFGELKLNIGDCLTDWKDYRKCCCVKPPFVHCVQVPKSF